MARDGGAASAEPRTDDYALLPGSAVVGVKLRAGRLEIKALARAVGPLRLTPAIEGLVETWVKLAVQVPDGPGLDRSLRAKAVMVSIDKTRWLRRFALAGAAGPVEVAAGTTPARGCDVELTRLRVRGSDWWTVGLEAFGDPPGIEGSLGRTARAVLLSGAPPAGSRSATPHPTRLGSDRWGWPDDPFGPGFQGSPLLASMQAHP